MTSRHDQKPPDGTFARIDERTVSRDKPWTVLLVDTDEVRLDLYTMWLADRFHVRTVTSPAELADELDETAAVVFVGAGIPNDDRPSLASLVRGRVSTCRLLVATDGAGPTGLSDGEYDMCLQEPIFRRELCAGVERLARRAAYDATIRRFYNCSTTLASLEVQHTTEELRDHEWYRALNERVAELQTRLDSIAAHLDGSDVAAVLDSLRPDVAFPTDDEREQSSQGKYRPDECSRCGLAWGVEHGEDLGDGYKRLAAFVWECSQCNTVQSIPDPSDRRVARR